MTVIRVAAPATTANLGPGYDCLGMALDLWNTVEVEELPGGSAPSVSVSGAGAGELEDGPDNLVYRSMEFLFRELGRPMPPLRVRCDNEIPLARGLGSSAAAIAGGLAAANAMANMTGAGGEFGQRDLLEMAATIEGHPDNVAAAVMGGLQLVVTEENTLYSVPVSVPAAIHAVVFIPDVRVATADARAVLPQQLVRRRRGTQHGPRRPAGGRHGHQPPRVPGRRHAGQAAPTLPPAALPGHEAADESGHGRRSAGGVPLRQRLHRPGPDPRARDDRGL